MIRWPFYLFEVTFGLTAIALSLYAWRKRYYSWIGTVLIPLPWLFACVLYGGFMLTEVIENGWKDVTPSVMYAIMVNTVALMGPVSIVAIRTLRLWKRG
jgi:hypothetical protein